MPFLVTVVLVVVELRTSLNMRLCELKWKTSTSVFTGFIADRNETKLSNSVDCSQVIGDAKHI